MKYIELENNLQYKLNFDRVVYLRYIFWYDLLVVLLKINYFIFYLCRKLK